MARRLTKDQFVAKARAVHGDCFDYSSVDYVNSHTKILIRCVSHGEFTQKPSNHLSGFGCLKCGHRMAGQYHKKDTDSFILDAQAVHGDAYNYSKTVYKGAREPLSVICRTHGIFEQLAYAHLRSSPREACLKCSYAGRGDRSLLSCDAFLQRADVIHQGRYDYSKVASGFNGANKAVSIVCREHGEWRQLPAAHLSGKGCQKCADVRLGDQFRKSTDDFVSDARRVHGDIYDYCDVEYNGAFKNVTIICAIDGSFEQSPTSHLAGIGCPRCSRRAQGAPRNLVRAVRGEFDDKKPSFVYVVTFTLPMLRFQLFKVGTGSGSRLKSTLSSIRRVGGIISDTCRRELSSTGEAIVFEQLAHQQIRQKQFAIPREFKFAGHSEIFTCMPDFDAIEQHEMLARFRGGERWAIKRAGKNNGR